MNSLNIVKAVRNIICALDAFNLFENLDKQNWSLMKFLQLQIIQNF